MCGSFLSHPPNPLNTTISRRTVTPLVGRQVWGRIGGDGMKPTSKWRVLVLEETFDETVDTMHWLVMQDLLVMTVCIYSQLVLYRFESSLYCSVAITFLLLFQLIPSIITSFNLYSWFLVLPSAVLFTMVWRITCWTCDCQPLPSLKELIKMDLWVR